MSESNVNDSLVSVNDFNFNAEHNGVRCIESIKHEDRGTERQYWFSAKMLATIFDCADPKTIRSRIETLVNTGDLDVGKNFLTSQVPNSVGAMHETMLYNLTVFNKLAMTFIDNPRAVEMRKAFNDVLVKKETNTSNSTEIKPYIENNMIVMPNFNDPIAAARAWADMYEAQRNAELKAKFEAEQKALAISQRDYAIATKSWIGSKREATAMNTASQKSKECKRLTAENKTLTDTNTELVTENDKLKDEIGFGSNWKQVTAIDWYDEFFVKKRDNNFYSQCGKILTKISKEMDIMPKRIEDTKYPKNCYYIAVVDEFKKRLSDGCVFQNLVKYYKNNDRPSDNNNQHIERSLF